MTETVEEQSVGVEERAVVIALDLDGSNPFWPKNMGTAGVDVGAANMITVNSVTFGADPADVTVAITTTPVNTAWTINWGDGTATAPITAGTNQATHHYADKSSGKAYIITVVSGTDTDTKTVQY